MEIAGSVPGSFAHAPDSSLEKKKTNKKNTRGTGHTMLLILLLLPFGSRELEKKEKYLRCNLTGS